MAERSARTRGRREDDATGGADGDFLATLGAALLGEIEPDTILSTTAAMLGRHLGVDNVVFFDQDPAGEHLLPMHEWTPDGVARLRGLRLPITSMGSPEVIAEAMRGAAITVHDVATEPAATDDVRNAYARLGVAASLSVPLVKTERFHFALTVATRLPRRWTEAEVALVRAVAARTWATLEHGRAQATLRSSEERFRTLADNLPGLCWMADPAGRPFWFNRQWRDYCGEAIDPIAALPEGVVAERWRAAIAAGEAFEMTLPLCGASGDTRPFQTRMQPVTDDQGRIARWLGVGTDIGEEERTKRDQAFTLALGDRLRTETDAGVILDETVKRLGEHLGASRVGYADIDMGRDRIVVDHVWTDGSVRSIVGEHTLAGFGPEVVASHSRGETFVMADVAADDRVGASHRPVFEALQIIAGITVPLVKAGRLVALLSVHDKTPRKWTPAEVDLVEEVAERTWATAERARAEARLRVRERNQAFLLMLGDRLRTEADPLAILDKSAELLGAHMRARYVIYGEMEDNDDYVVINHHWTDRSAPRRSGRWRMEDLGADNVAAYARGEHRAIADMATDERVPQSLRDEFSRMSIRSYLTVPLVKAGRLSSFLSVQRTNPSQWTPADVELVREVAERTWAALERAHAEALVRENERRQSFLLALGDRLRREADDPLEVIAATAETLGHHMGVDRVVFGEIEDDHMLVDHDWTRDNRSLAAHRIPLATLGGDIVDAQAGGEILSVPDLATDPRIPQSLRDAFTAIDIAAFLTAPMAKGGRLAALMSVQHRTPRVWTDDEATLLREVAERTWAALERARAEAQLRASEEQFRTLAEHLPSLCWMAEADGATFWHNQRWYDYFGPDVGHEAGWRWDNVIEGEAAPRVEARWQRSLETGEAFEMTVPLVGADGVARPFLTQLQPVKDARGRVTRWLGINTDVSAQQEAERSQALLLALGDRLRRETDPGVILNEIAESLGQHLRASRVNYVEVDAEHERLMVEHDWTDGLPSAIGSFGYDAIGAGIMAEHATGRTFVADDMRTDARFDAGGRAVYERVGSTAFVTVPLVRGDRLAAMLSVQQASPRHWTDAEVRLIEEVAERTWATLERARAEARQRESQALLAAIMDNAPVGLYMKDAAGRYVLANPEMGNLFGRPVDEIVGRTAGELLGADYGAMIASRDAEVLAARRTIAVEEYRPSAGAYEWTLVIRFPVETRPGAPLQVGGFDIDITAQKRAEAALERSRESLYQTEKLSALGSLLAGVSHELNNPLSIIVAQSTMLERQAGGTPQAERAEKIRKAAERSAKIVQTFLAMARQKRPERGQVDINEVLRAALELADYGLRTAGVTVTVALEPALPSLWADADQLHQVFVNLIINAQHALQDHDGPRRLTVTTRHARAASGVEIEIADSGPGVPADIRRRIFEPFFTTKPQEIGTGVGLSFSLGLVEAHGGRLELLDRSAGATFVVTLPVGHATANAAPPAPRAARAAPAPARALVVDDEPDIADSLAELLAFEGYAVEVAGGGREAQAKLAASDYDLILSDLRMPDVDGPALFAWIEAERPRLARRIAFVTGDTLGTNAVRFLARAGCPYIEKPFSPATLAQLVADIRHRNATEAAA